MLKLLQWKSLARFYGRRRNNFWRLNVAGLTKQTVKEAWLEAVGTVSARERETWKRRYLPNIDLELKSENGRNLCTQVITDHRIVSVGSDL